MSGPTPEEQERKKYEFDDWFDANMKNKESVPIGTLLRATDCISNIKYSSKGKGFYKLFSNFFETYLIDVKVLKEFDRPNDYRKVPSKYWGLFYFFMEKLYPPNGSKLKNEFLYIFFRSKDEIKYRNELDIQESVYRLIYEIRKLYKGYMLNHEQHLFNAFGQSYSIPFSSLREIQNEYILKNYKSFCNSEDISALERYIKDNFGNKEKFKLYINNLFNDETSYTKEFIELGRKVKKAASNTNDFPQFCCLCDEEKSKTFNEDEFEILLNSFLHSFKLRTFYEEIEKNYIDPIRYLQAIVDINYISSILKSTDSSETPYNKELLNIKDYIKEKYEKILEGFISDYNEFTHQHNLDEISDDRILEKLNLAITYENINEVIKNNRILCDSLNKHKIFTKYIGNVSPIIDKIKYHSF